MNMKEIKDVIALMNENGLNEFELEKDGFKIKLIKDSKGAIGQTVIQPAQPVQVVQDAAQPAPSAAGSPAPAQETAPAQDDANTVVVKSPMVGTFYSSPSPDADPFVVVGQSIEEGDTLCILEAMKLMNEIKSEVKGSVVEILVENGQAIEFDQPLFKVKKA